MAERAGFAAKYAWIFGLAAALLVLVFALYQRSPGGRPPEQAAAPGEALPKSGITLEIGTSGTGGAYYPLGGALAAVLSKSLPNVRASAEVTGGSADNLRRIGAGQSQIGLSIADVALEAARGEERFAGGKIPLATLLVLYPNRLHLVTVEGAGIDKISDLKGKRVSTGVPGSATEATALRLLAAIGLDRDKDIKRERLSPIESASAIAMKERKLDAFFWLGTVPTPSIAELAAAPGVKMKLIDHADAVAAMNAKYGGLYSAGTIAAGSYPGQDKDHTNAEIWNLLVVDEKMTDDFAYALVKTIFENKPELVAIRREAENWTLTAQKREHSPIPFHPGAIRYFKEKSPNF
ncbi:MAG TPA: TAXI family TRAP transporter solute-binding subunit [Xanthobacteraceae bacterium]|nr:TAXI family TRAP transporter solute-binding subunit [Xanthobacteraceae bacterium]